MRQVVTKQISDRDWNATPPPYSNFCLRWSGK